MIEAAVRTCTAMLLAAAGLAAQDGESPEALQVMSFNIRYGTARDGGDHWDRRRELVASTIIERAPDVLGLQEALAFQLAFLRDRLGPRYRLVGQGRKGGEKGEFACILFDRERLALERSGDFWLSESPDEVASVGWDAALPRICTWAVLRVRATGARFAVLNAHFDHRGATARRRSAALIAERLARFAALPVLVTGDLNAGENSGPLRELRAAGLRDTFRVRHANAEPAGTFNGFRGDDSGSKIDYILCSPDWRVRAASIVKANDGGRYPSDHFPVTAALPPITADPLFELGGKMDGWNSEGGAFDQQPPDQDGHPVLSSESENGATGTLRSPDFMLPDGALFLAVAGNRNRERTFVALRLEDSARELQRATGPGGGRWQRIGWEIGDAAGKRAYLVLVDDSGGDGQHIAIADIRVTR